MSKKRRPTPRRAQARARRAEPARPSDDPGRIKVPHPFGAYLVRYTHSAPFTMTGRLGETYGGSIGRIPAIVQEDGQIAVLDPRAIITLDGRRMYGPRDLNADDHTAEMREWLTKHPEWDT